MREQQVLGQLLQTISRCVARQQPRRLRCIYLRWGCYSHFCLERFCTCFLAVSASGPVGGAALDIDLITDRDDPGAYALVLATLDFTEVLET